MLNATIQVGDVIPEGIVLYTSGNTDEKGACALPKKTDTTTLFKGKKAVLIGIPIPFSPTCSLQQLPGFVERAGELKSKGVDVVACINTYDVFVQDAWGKAQGAGDKVVMLSDSNGDLLRALGLTQDLSKLPMPLGAMISKRFALVLDDLKVTYFGLDPTGLEHSSVESVLAHL
ncbi:hypothetical protein HDU97_009397 [Phlyctochytrium planicorne]|nr:hypothetical protein HDU97_009397 [Phlyctochytrium planicorne]